MASPVAALRVERLLTFGRRDLIVDRCPGPVPTGPFLGTVEGGPEDDDEAAPGEEDHWTAEDFQTDRSSLSSRAVGSKAGISVVYKCSVWAC